MCLTVDLDLQVAFLAMAVNVEGSRVVLLPLDQPVAVGGCRGGISDLLPDRGSWVTEIHDVVQQYI